MVEHCRAADGSWLNLQPVYSQQVIESVHIALGRLNFNSWFRILGALLEGFSRIVHKLGEIAGDTRRTRDGAGFCGKAPLPTESVAGAAGHVDHLPGDE